MSALGAPAAMLLFVTVGVFFVCGYMLLRPFCLPKRPCRCLQAREITVILHSDNVSQNLCKKSNKKFSVGRYKWRKSSIIILKCIILYKISEISNWRQINQSKMR